MNLHLNYTLHFNLHLHCQGHDWSVLTMKQDTKHVFATPNVSFFIPYFTDHQTGPHASHWIDASLALTGIMKNITFHEHHAPHHTAKHTQ